MRNSVFLAFLLALSLAAETNCFIKSINLDCANQTLQSLITCKFSKISVFVMLTSFIGAISYKAYKQSIKRSEIKESNIKRIKQEPQQQWAGSSLKYLLINLERKNHNAQSKQKSVDCGADKNFYANLQHASSEIHEMLKKEELHDEDKKHSHNSEEIENKKKLGTKKTTHKCSCCHHNHK